jgi:D-glycero-alpha-D-manno-heptose 1-phosphate guanylyltransferase
MRILLEKSSDMEKKFKLIVLAGGFGTRLQSLLPNTPKPMAPVGDLPFLHFQIENWISQGVNSFVFLLHHQADQITNFLGKIKNELLKNCEVVSLVEPLPMDTGGAVAYAVRELGLDGDLLVINSDTWLGAGIRELAGSQPPAMAVLRVENAGRYGKVEFNDDYLITAFDEKNELGDSGWINAGLCKLHSDLFDKWDGARFSLEGQIFPRLVNSCKLRAVITTPEFIDIGIPEDYRKFCVWIKEGRRGSLCN